MWPFSWSDSANPQWVGDMAQTNIIRDEATTWIINLGILNLPSGSQYGNLGWNGNPSPNTLRKKGYDGLVIISHSHTT